MQAISFVFMWRCTCTLRCLSVQACVRGSVQPPEIMQASNNDQIEPPHADTHQHMCKHAHTHTAQGQAQRQGSRGVLAVGGCEKQIMINWLTFYKTLPLMHLG